MRLRLFRMGIEGKVAVANLSLVGLNMIVRLIAFPGGMVHGAPITMYPIALVLELMFAGLTFPIGFLAMCVTWEWGSGPVFAVATAICVPLNAYLWGYVAATIMGRRGAGRTAASSVEGTSVDS